MWIFDWIGANFGSILFWIVFAVVFIVFAVIALRNMNHNYTVGSGLFKNSDGNLNKDEKLDVSDYNYYNENGKSE